MSVWWLILIIPASLILLLLILLSLPLGYRLQGFISAAAKLSFSANLWRFFRYQGEYANRRFSHRIFLFGLGKSLSTDPKSKDQKKRQEEKRKRKQEAKKKTKKEAFWKKQGLRETLTFARDVINMVRPRVLRVSGNLGLSEPHLLGYVLALIPTLRQGGLLIDINPVWEEETCDLSLYCEGKITPIMLIVRFLAYLVSPRLRRIRNRFRPKNHQA